MAARAHIHADHLSRAKQVVERTGATLLLPTQGRATFPFTPVSDGDQIVCGRSMLRTLHTPGHTAESTSYLLNGQALFTGDTLFVNGVGRPDLHADMAGAQQRASLLFHSLKRLEVLGAHEAITIAFERYAVQQGRWAYAPDMPMLFGIGLLPLAQWIVVPLITLFLLRAAVRQTLQAGIRRHSR